MLPPEMVRFLVDRTTATFDCTTIPADIATGPAGYFFKVQFYTSWIAALLWRFLGTSQMALAPYAAVLGAGYAAGGFVLARLFLPRLLALIAGLAIALSPVAIGQMFSLRDFSKGPLLLWTIALLIIAVRTHSARRAARIATLAAVVAGIGFGFRPDLMIMLPLGSMFLLGAPRWKLLPRAGIVGLYAGILVLLAAPLLALGNGARVGSFVMQGATEPFRAFLALRSAPYALGDAYSDELTLSAIAAAERPRRPNWDAKEPGPIYGMSQSLTLSTDNLIEWAPRFAADFMAQALKGAAWIMGYPALVAVSRGNPDPAFPARLDVPITRWQEPVYAAFGQNWMPFLGLAGTLALLLLVAARSGWEALATAGLLLALLSYPFIEFSVRHIFYLEFLWPIALLSLPCALWQFRRLLPVLPGFLACAALVLGTLAGSYAVLAAFQQRWLTASFSQLLALPREPVPFERVVQDDGTVLLRVPVAAEDVAILAAGADSMTDRIAQIGVVWNVRATGYRMLMTLGGAACPHAEARIALEYAHEPHVWEKLDSSLTMQPGDTAIFPAFYRGTQHFAGILLPASDAECVVSLSRLPLSYDLPLVLTAVLPPHWQELALRKGLGRFDVSPPQ
jgi:hypothetical protein